MIRGKNFLTAVSILFTALVLYTCAGSAPVSQGTSSMWQANTGQQQTASSQPAPIQPATPPAPVYYSGDGGGGIRLAVLVPGSSGLGAEQNYLPTLVQGVLVGDLSKYSAMSVLDRMRLETVLRETESGIYKNEADYGQLGEIANVDYALTGSITRTNTGYAMQIQVVGTGSENIGVTRASYSGSCTIAEFDNFTGIRKASLELLTQMGVNLTETARQELNAAAEANNVSAQTALAQGIIAQRGGHTIESLALFYEAGNYDSSIDEAVSRASTLSATIRTGSWIENIRNDIAWRNEWRNIIQEYINWYNNYLKPDFIYTELIYDPEIRIGSVNYQNDTIQLRYTAQISRPAIPDEYFYPHKRLEAEIRAGLNATGRNNDWRLNVPSYNVYLQPSDLLFYLYSASLINDQGKVIGSHGYEISRGQPNYIHIIRGTLPTDFRGEFLTRFNGIDFDNYSNSRAPKYYASYFLEGLFTVKINDFTDVLHIKIDSIYEFRPLPPNMSGNNFTLNRQGSDIIPVRTASLPSVVQTAIEPYTYTLR
ncbi:MAG: hypothetical protein FWC03_12370 [Treponema sp.]|nr:hypothetical protein [Treponema sp.]